MTLQHLTRKKVLGEIFIRLKVSYYSFTQIKIHYRLGVRNAHVFVDFFLFKHRVLSLNIPYLYIFTFLKNNTKKQANF